ncbi:MAG TPA: hypothetical protein VHR47_01395 [Bacillota bacterium]|nr:hypothetical protein [Bacillota bacterium]
MLPLALLFWSGAEFEGKISDRFSYCIDGSYYWLLGAELTAFSVGGKYYFNGETMDGMYIGTQIGNMHGSGKFLGIFETDGDDPFAQLRLGYKKATARGFTYDLGIYGVCWDDGDVDGGVSFGFGYSW